MTTKRTQLSAAVARRRALGHVEVTSIGLPPLVRRHLEALALAAGKSRSAMVAELVMERTLGLR